MDNRIYNFSAGPAIMPVDVLKEAQEDLISYKGTGMSEQGRPGGWCRARSPVASGS